MPTQVGVMCRPRFSPDRSAARFEYVHLLHGAHIQNRNLSLAETPKKLRVHEKARPVPYGDDLARMPMESCKCMYLQMMFVVRLDVRTDVRSR